MDFYNHQLFSDRETNGLRSALLPGLFYGLSAADLPHPLATIRTGFSVRKLCYFSSCLLLRIYT